VSASVSETMRVQRCVLLHAGSAHTCGCCSVGQIGFSFFVDILVRTLTVPWFFTSCSRAARAPVGFHTCRSTGCRVCPVNVHMHTLSALTCSPRVTGDLLDLLSNLGGFVIRVRIPCIVHVSCMYRERILMCPVHQDTSGYNKIHLQIRTSLDTIEIHVSHYVSLMYVVSRMYPQCILEPLQIHVSHKCIPHVSRMYPTSKIHIS
jgi:hypothetical protein